MTYNWIFCSALLRVLFFGRAALLFSALLSNFGPHYSIAALGFYWHSFSQPLCSLVFCSAIL